MPALANGLGLSRTRFGGGDSTPGGATNVWMWEAGIGIQWETGYFIQTN
jgi:hypothetical protein